MKKKQKSGSNFFALGRIITAAAIALLGMGTAIHAETGPLRVASSSSIDNASLMTHLLPQFEMMAGFKVKLLPFGTGQALKLARAGKVDMLITHDERAEKEFIESGFGADRHPFMYNDFLIVGPAGDPAGIRGMTDAVAAFQSINAAQADFVSRADISGTHKKELRLWIEARLDVKRFDPDWYHEAGTNMTATLNAAGSLAAYTLVDRGTWLARGDGLSLEVMVEGDQRLFNQYSVVLISPERFPSRQHEKARRLADWIVSPEGQAAIGAYRLKGQQPFQPNARGAR